MKPPLKNLVLIGYRGAGKSLVAEELGKKLRRPLFSSDLLLEARVGDLTSFIEKAGWDKFRSLESEVIADLSQKSGIIIDTGGGVVERRKNLVRLKKKGIVIWLAVPEETLIDRLRTVARPRLEVKLSLEAETKKKLSERAPLYEAFSELRLDGRKKPSELAKEVAAYCFKCR